MAARQVGTGGDIRQGTEARWSLSRTLEKIRSLRPNFNNGYLTHAIFENMRKQEIGKLFLNMIVPTLGVTAFIWYKSDNPNKILFGIFLLLLFAGGLAIFNGLLLRDTYPRPACIIEQLGIVLVFLSITSLVATLLTGAALIIPVFCVGLVLLPFIIPTLPRDDHVV